MEKKLSRKDFLKISSGAGLAWFLTACGTREEKINNSTTSPPVTNDTVINTPEEEKSNVIFYQEQDSEYANLNAGFNKRIQKKPRIIALCKNSNGVAEAIRYAKENKLPVAIKSGGHSFEGFSSNDDGLVINLSLLNKVEWLGDDKISVGPGCKLGQLYDEVLPKKRIIPAGSCATVGVAGLTLGGGYGFFSRKYGLTCDSLLEVKMVDNNGTLHSSNDDPELLWACKGGGNGNFGVITEMVFQTQPAPNTFQSHRFKAFNLTAERATILLEKWFIVSAKLPPACFSAFVLNHKTLTILVTNYENHNNEIQALLDELSPLCDKTTIGSRVELSKALKTFYGVQTPIYFKNASAGLYTDFAQIRDCITTVMDKVINTNGLIYQVNTLGGKISDPDFQKNSAYAHRDLPYLSELQAYWSETAKENKLTSAFQEIQQTFKNHGITAQYCNYPDLNFSDWKKAYYGSSYKRLQEIKSKYDPHNLIHHEQSVLPIEITS